VGCSIALRAVVRSVGSGGKLLGAHSNAGRCGAGIVLLFTVLIALARGRCDHRRDGDSLLALPPLKRRD
jgi:hypothetical protein